MGVEACHRGASYLAAGYAGAVVSSAKRLRRQPRFLIALVLVAAAAGSFAIVFRKTLAWTLAAVSGATNVVEAIVHTDWWWRLAMPTLGALAAGILARSIARRGGGGVSDVMEAVALGQSKLSLRVTLVKSAASWCAIVTGGSLGREGPLIQFGGASGHAIGTRFGLSSDERRVLITAGTAAGFAAAYNTPLAAVAFVLEIVAGVIVVETVVPTLIATVIATALTRAAVGPGPIYGTRHFMLTSPGELFAYAGVGVCASLFALGFSWMVSTGEELFRRPWLAPPWRQALGGLCAGAILIFVPSVAGNGYEPLNGLLGSAPAIGFVLALLVAKAFATTASVASGSPGGVFTPTLLMGGCAGCLFHLALSAANLDVGPAGGYTLVGMAAAIAAATHAPLMGAVLAFELSGDYAVVLPLVLATAVATAVARMLGRQSMYMAELRERGLSWEMTHKGREVRFDGPSPDAPWGP
jgi:CIC family chloride channel protein